MYLHYIWVGNQKTSLVNKCIESYYKYCNKFDIIEWDESNINVDEFNPTLQKFYNYWYENKHYAYCSDIARLYILNKYKGLYVDTDVEFIKEIPNDMLNENFMGIESFNKKVGCGLVWNTTENEKWINTLINVYTYRLNKDSNTYGSKWIFNTLIRSYFKHHGFLENDTTQFINNYRIYSSEYFCPLNFFTRKMNITDKTISIHHYNNSWHKKIKNK